MTLRARLLFSVLNLCVTQVLNLRGSHSYGAHRLWYSLVRDVVDEILTQ